MHSVSSICCGKSIFKVIFIMLRYLACYIPILLANLNLIHLNAQDFTGQWRGFITIEGRQDTFMYEVNLTGDSNNLNGNAFCFVKDTSAYARFNLVGVMESDQLILQEVEQTEPNTEKWCHKYLKLSWSDDQNTLKGRWTASNCSPGTVQLERVFITETKIRTEEQPFSFEGKWIGQLVQSDRSYGFYLEMDLDQNKSGTSFIESEAEGGNATMNMKWEGGVEADLFRFEELGIIEKSVTDWRWCIKQGKLQVKRAKHKYILEGPWQGFIEGYTQQTGACAPGRIIFEKPILSRQIEETVKKETQKYQATNQRKIKVQRIIEVKSNELKLRTWDSGDVDGDIITVFLNGRQLLVKYRVSKRRYAFPVTLAEDNNFLMLHADDIGDISPNTVAVSIDDGVKEQMVVLSSDLEESGAILIKKIEIDK